MLFVLQSLTLINSNSRKTGEFFEHNRKKVLWLDIYPQKKNRWS